MAMMGSQMLQRAGAQPLVASSACRAPARPLVAPRRLSRRPAAAIAATAKAPVAPVRITIQGRRLPVTDAIKQYVEEKVSKAVANYSTNIKKIDVTLSARGGDTGTHGAKQQKVDVTITTMRAGVVRVEDSEASLYASIDLVCDKVSRKLQKVKDKLIAKGKWPGKAGPRVDTEGEDFKEYMESIVEAFSLGEDEARAAELAVPQAAPEVVRSKVVRCDDMSPDEAIDAMLAVGHSFFMYRDSESGQINVVYRRDSGGYGLLIPQ